MRRYRQGVREAKRHEIMVDPRWLRVIEKPRHEIMDNRYSIEKDKGRIRRYRQDVRDREEA